MANFLIFLAGAFGGSFFTFLVMCFAFAVGDREDKKNDSKANDEM